MGTLSAPAALYARVVEQVADEVRAGGLNHGDRLPSERELAERFAVSRVTIRRALAELTARGLIESQPGRGTFVINRVVDESATALVSFSELGAERGLTASARVLSHGHRPSTYEEALAFDIAPSSMVFVLKRVLMLDKLPVSIDHSRVPESRAPGLGTVDFAAASLYRALDERHATPVRADYTVRASAATARQARQLDVPVGFPLLHTTTTSCDRAGAIVEMGEMFYRSDRYQFRAHLVRNFG